MRIAGEQTTAVDEATTQLDLADQAMARSDCDAAVTHLSAAIRELTAAGEVRRAAMTCARLGDLYANYLSNLTAARVWFVRATRLVENEPPCIEQGWVAVAAMGCDVDDPQELLDRAELALERARQFGDVNLEMKALADGGLAHVQAGRVRQGMAMLDEAMALVCGPSDNVDAAGRSVCSFFTACYFAADFHRAQSWADPLTRHGLLGAEPGVQLFAGNHCDSVHATALCEVGRWDDAEALLTKAAEEFEARMGMPSWHPAIALAELRIRQGRLADAEMLLLGKDGHLQALLPAARLHLARGDHDLARAMAERGLRAIGDDRLRAADLLGVLVECEIATGNLDAATAACEELTNRIGSSDVGGLQARLALTRGLLQAAGGDFAAAIGTLEDGLDRLEPGPAVLRSSLLLGLVRFHETIGNRAAAHVEARRALAALAGLDVAIAPEDRELLDRVGATPPTVGRSARQVTATLARQDRHWVATCRESRARIPDSKGLRYLAELLRNPGAERHVLDLVDREEGLADEPGLDRRHLGSAGELLDTQARSAYRHRIEALRLEIDDAFSSGAEDKAELLQGELDQLVQQLAEAFGLGGRSRRASSAAERARLNVTRALRSATTRLREALPEAGSDLDRRVRTGLYCAYEPDAADEVVWIVQSALNEVPPA